MRKSKLYFVGMVITALSLITSCSTSEDTPSISDDTNNTGYALWLITDTEDFSGMLLTSKTPFSGEIDPTEESYSLLGAARDAGISYHGDIYNVHNSSGDSGIQRYVYNQNKLSDAGFISVGETLFTFEVVNDTKGYYTDANRSTTAIQTFNPSTMSRTGEIDIASAIQPYITDDVTSTRLGSFMIESNGYLYTQVKFNNSDGYEAIDSTFVAVFNVNTDKFVKMAIYPDYIWLGFERKNTNYVQKDENGNIYLSSLAGNLNERMHTRCLRIKAGETDFDKTWSLDYDDIIGEKGSFAMGGGATLNGKLYVRLKETGMAANWSNSMEENMYAYEVDIKTKIATKIEGIPGSTSSVLYSVNGPVIIDGLVYFAVSSSNYQGYYTYNPATGESKEAFNIKGGIPSQLIKIN